MAMSCEGAVRDAGERAGSTFDDDEDSDDEDAVASAPPTPTGRGRRGMLSCTLAACPEGLAPDGALSTYGLALVGALLGIAMGLLVKLFQTVLEELLEVFWIQIPDALEHAGWAPAGADSWSFGLQHYTWLLNAGFGVVVGVLSRACALDAAAAPTLGAWVRHLHESPTGSAPAGRWIGNVLLLGLLTALSGASVGPEPIVVILPSVLAGAFASGPLRQPPHAARALALAGGGGGLSAFFGLPVASAFALLELPSIDGAQFALEAMPACLAASLMGALFGNCLWNPGNLFGHNEFWFPGGDGPAANVTSPKFGLGAVAYGAIVGLVGGCASHFLAFSMRVLHPVFAFLKGGARGHALRGVALLAVAGGINGALGMLFPSALFWSEGELQVALTRGCAAWRRGSYSGCQPVELPHMHPGLIPAWAVQASAGEPMSAASMFSVAATKLFMITLCEGTGFVGGAIYPVIFMGASLGSAIGASPAVSSLGGEYVYLSTAAPMAVALAALLNTPLFAVLLVLVLQKNIPHGTVSSQLISLACAVYTHYFLARGLIIPRLNLIRPQRHRSDINYMSFTVLSSLATLEEEAAAAAAEEGAEAISRSPSASHGDAGGSDSDEEEPAELRGDGEGA